MAKSERITHLNYNIVVMGDPYCGKSSIIERYVTGKYGPNYIQTIGSEYAKKKLEIEGNPVMLYVYDTAGQEDMKTVIKSIYRKAQGILLVFDFSRKKTFDHIRDWIDLIQMNCDITPEMVLVGNKVDLQHLPVTTADVEVTIAIDGTDALCTGYIGRILNCLQKFAESHNLPFLNVSAKRNYNIEEAFNKLSKNIFINRKRLYPCNMITSIQLKQDQNENNNSCCS